MTTSSKISSSRSLDRELAALVDGEYASRLHLRALAIADGNACVEMPFDPTIMNRGGRVHGGALASLLFAAARVAAAASERAESARQVRLLTANVAFLATPRHGRLVAAARIARRGREVAHATVEAVDDGGALMASAGITIGLVDADFAGETAMRYEKSVARPDVRAGRPVPGSPYLSAAGMLILPAEARTARALLPQARNRALQPSRVDEGAVAGLADSCAAYAAHLCQTGVGDRGGLTVSMALAFHSVREEDLIGAGVVTGHAAGCYLSVVEVVGAASGISAASGFAVYRLPA